MGGEDSEKCAGVEAWEGKERLRRGVARRASAEDVVPIVERRWQELDGGMKGDHGLSHGLADGVEIEAAPQTATLVKEVKHPRGIGPCAGGGQTTVLGMEHMAADGVDGRFTEDDLGSRDGGNGEEAEIFTGTRGHAAPKGVSPGYCRVCC